jgi:hypothetical protein
VIIQELDPTVAESYLSGDASNLVHLLFQGLELLTDADVIQKIGSSMSAFPYYQFNNGFSRLLFCWKHMS